MKHCRAYQKREVKKRNRCHLFLNEEKKFRNQHQIWISKLHTTCREWNWLSRAHLNKIGRIFHTTVTKNCRKSIKMLKLCSTPWNVLCAQKMIHISSWGLLCRRLMWFQILWCSSRLMFKGNLHLADSWLHMGKDSMSIELLKLDLVLLEVV